jgi:uncharacterized protein YwqG
LHAALGACVESKDDLSGLCDAEFLQAYINNVQAYEKLEHIGAMNRMMDRRSVIFEELKRRSGGSLQSMRPLLDHPDLNVRHTAAIHFRTIDHDAFLAVMQALIACGGEAEKEAKDSILWDEHFQEFGYPEHEQSRQQPPNPDAWKTHWQADVAPPDAMSVEEIGQRLFEALPCEAADRLLALARPAIGLWPRHPPSDLSAHASRLGGEPVAPPGWKWPMVETEPMLFLGQIACADLQRFPGAEPLPATGILSFFGDHDDVMGCDSWGSVGVFYWQDRDALEPVAPPLEPIVDILPCALSFRPLIDLPHPWSRAVTSFLTDKDVREIYASVWRAVREHGIPDDLVWHCSFSKLLGWPVLVQYEDVEEIGDGRHLLLQLDDYSNGSDLMFWGPGGSLYFLMRDADLRARRFDECELAIQVT